jgi:hypothetical protein
LTPRALVAHDGADVERPRAESTLRDRRSDERGEGARGLAAPREPRVVALRALMGTPDRSVAPLAQGIRATARRHFDRHVLPLVEEHWPSLVGDALLREAADRRLRSLRLGALHRALLRAAGARCSCAWSPSAGNHLPLPAPALALLGSGAMELLGRFAYPEEHRRIALISAFIVVVDHVLDHCMDDPPARAARGSPAVIEGRSPRRARSSRSPARSPWRWPSASTRSERGIFEAAMERVHAWIRAEVAAMLGEPDPRGLGHRLAGVEGTIDGLLFPVLRQAGDGARAWMYDVSLFVQIMDDWLDFEVDARSDRSTPVVTGDWTFADVSSHLAAHAPRDRGPGARLGASLAALRALRARRLRADDARGHRGDDRAPRRLRERA